jgi:uncharacterized protein
MGLAMKHECERCRRALPPDAADARICTYECTFCAACVATHLDDVCPNCGGGFVPRPIRPKVERRRGVSLGHQPAATRRRQLNYERTEIARFVAGVRDIPPVER